MKTSRIVLVMALLAITIVPAAFLGGCSEEKFSNPVASAVTPADNNVNPSDVVETRPGAEPAAAGVGQFDAFPSAWRFPFKGSSKITVGYNGNSCGLGYVSTHTGKDQYAIDWSRLSGDADVGDPLYAPASGWYGGPGWDPNGYGKYVRIDAGNGYSYLIGHMNSIALNYCGWVNKGQYIGTLGRTGNCSGAHIHFVVYKNGWSVIQNGISGQWDLRICSTYSSGW